MIETTFAILFIALAIVVLLRAMRRMSTETRRVEYLDNLLHQPVTPLRTRGRA